jgi:hypothetical protein
MENDSQKCHIRDVCPAANNPQSNAICKRIHQAIGNILWTNIWGHIAKHMGTSCQYKIYGDRLLIQKNIYGISLITMHGMRAGVHSTLGSSAGNLVFNRDIDMFLNIPLIAGWHAITQKREHLIHESLIQENQKRRW